MKLTRGPRLTWLVPVTAGLLLLVLSACAVEPGPAGIGVPSQVDTSGATSDGAEEPALEGTFVSTSVSGHELVDGSVVRMTFEADHVSVQAGCNTMFGGYTMEGGTLQVAALAQTEMACAPELMEQDQWLAALLQDGPEVTETANGIVLSGGGVELELTDREVAEPDLALEGQTWVLDTAYTETALTNIRGMEKASIVFEDGSVHVNTGCNTGGGSYQLDGDGLSLGPLRMTLRACEDSAMEIEQLMTGVLNQMDLTVQIEASTLKLSAPDGTALGFVAVIAADSDAEATTAP